MIREGWAHENVGKWVYGADQIVVHALAKGETISITAEDE